MVWAQRDFFCGRRSSGTRAEASATKSPSNSHAQIVGAQVSPAAFFDRRCSKANFCRPLAWLWLFAAVATVCIEAKNYTIRTWETADGLPQNSGTALARTSDGYLWVGTFNGLVRFNGTDFTRFTVASVKEFPTDDINGLFEDRSGRLWIGTYAGLVLYQGGRFTRQRLPEPLHDAVTRFFAVTSDGTLFVATDRGIARIKNGQVSPVELPGATWPAWTSLAARNDQVWAAHGRSLFQWRGDRFELEWTFPANIETLAVARDGTVWCGHGDALAWYRPGQAPTNAPIRVGPLRTLLETRSGGWWLGTVRDGLYFWDQGELSPVTTQEGLSNNRIMALAEDDEGSVWVGTDGGGFCRLTPALFRTFDVRDGLTDNDVISVVEDREGRIWLGTFSGALCVSENGKWRQFAPLDPLKPYEGVLALCQARDGTLWVGCKPGPMCQLRDGRLEAEPRSKIGTVRVLFEDRDGRLWAGSPTAGVECFAGNEVLRWSTTNGLSHDFITAMAQDAEGAIWIGTHSGLNRISGGVIRTYFTRDGIGANQIHSLFVDRDGVLWIGTAGGGLTRYRNGRFETLTSRHGLQSDVVAQILEHESDFWIGSTTGISRVNKQSLHDVLDGRARLIRSATYGRKDGMRASGCPGGYQPACTITGDGRLWFCTSAGVSVLDPRELRPPAFAPPVHIERVVVDGIPVNQTEGNFLPLASGVPVAWTKHSPARPENVRGPSQPVIIPPGSQRLELHCAALNLSAPERAHFAFWLEGFEDTWQEASSLRVAYYNRVPPGTYRFHVKARNAEGNEEESYASVALLVKPTWRQTWWYRGSMALFAAGMLGVFYHNRVKRLKQIAAQQADFSRQLIDSQEAERKRIATELHDSLGQSLLIIKNQARRTARTANSIETLQGCLNEIAQTAGEAVEDVRGIARALRPYQLDSLGLTRALQSLANQSAEAGNLKLSASIDTIDGLLSPHAEINVFRIVQESLNNVVKHADATELSVLVRATDPSVSIVIQDNGRGFEPEAVRRGTQNGGAFGLRGIEERIRLLGGQWKIESEAARGTRLSIELPRPKARQTQV